MEKNPGQNAMSRNFETKYLWFQVLSHDFIDLFYPVTRMSQVYLSFASHNW